MNNSIFDLFGLDSKSLRKGFEDFNLHDVVKNNKNISGAFDKLSDDEKVRVVDTMNKIQSSFDELFGTKNKKWTVDDFTGSNVSVSSYSSEDGNNEEKDVNKKEEKKLKRDEVTFNEADADDEEFEDYYPHCSDCDIDDCPDRVCDHSEDESNKNGYGTICEQLLAELNEEDTPDETNVDDIANYVLDVLNDKENKKYKLHPATNGVPAAVEVVVPPSIGKSDIVKNIHIVTMLRDMLVDIIGAYDAYISADVKGGGLVIYIPLTKI